MCYVIRDDLPLRILKFVQQLITGQRTRKLARCETHQRQLISGTEVMCGQQSQIFDRAKPQGVNRHIQSEQNLYSSSGMPIKK